MATHPGSDAPLEIGSILAETRKRHGIDIETVEERTKIRGKYLRALEDEEWDVLPGPAYTRGFIRAYAELLGLDSEVLVDEFRHRHEEPATRSYELAEPLLKGRGARDGSRPPGPRRLVIGAILAVVVLGLLVLGLTAGGDEEPDRRPEKAEREKPGRKRSGGGGGDGGAGSDRGGSQQLPAEVTMKLVAASDLQACVVDADGDVLVPDQLIAAGAEDGPYVSKRFRLELDPGAARVFVNGDPETRVSADAVAYRVTPAGVEEANFTGGLCR
ncbi:MAG: helix-turn-helix domain-containing protein [Solirubrobacterales bacterium]